MKKTIKTIINDIINSDFTYYFSFFLLVTVLTFPYILVLLEIIGFTDNESLIFLLILIVMPFPLYLLYFWYVKKLK